MNELTKGEIIALLALAVTTLAAIAAMVIIPKPRLRNVLLLSLALVYIVAFILAMNRTQAHLLEQTTQFKAEERTKNEDTQKPNIGKKEAQSEPATNLPTSSSPISKQKVPDQSEKDKAEHNRLEREAQEATQRAERERLAREETERSAREANARAEKEKAARQALEKEIRDKELKAEEETLDGLKGIVWRESPPSTIDGSDVHIEFQPKGRVKTRTLKNKDGWLFANESWFRVGNEIHKFLYDSKDSKKLISECVGTINGDRIEGNERHVLTGTVSPWRLIKAQW